jgi:hypothetical protein
VPNTPGTLKALAIKVLKTTVPLSHSVGPGQVGQQQDEHQQTGQVRDIHGTTELDGTLYASMKRLEACGICIGIFEDGRMRVVATEGETVAATDEGGTIYSPADMYYYIHLEPRDRRMLHAFKRKFGGTTEWRMRP